GAGWFEAEHGSLGFDFKTLGGRLEALGESCRIIKGMFSGEKTTFAGKHYAVEDALCVPPPIQEGGPPLLVAGSGRRVLLKIVAEYADMWNSTGNPEEIGELITTIGRHGDLLKRDCSAIEYTVMMPLVYTEDRERQDRLVAMFATVFGLSPEDSRARMMVGSKQQCLDKIAAYVDVGATHFIFMMTPPYPTEELGAFAEEVVPAAREIWPG
ncbi:MAG: LLM class flavin-dependent oxidoreductase, partial [Candidatus Binatia bacterium]